MIKTLNFETKIFLIKKRLTTMAISNYLVSPTLEIPAEFPTWFVLVKLIANPRNYS